MPKHKRSRSRERRRESSRERSSRHSSSRHKSERKSNRHSRDDKRDERSRDKDRKRSSKRDKSKERHKELSEEDKILALRREKLEKFKKDKLSKIAINISPESNGKESKEKDNETHQINDSATSEIVEKRKRNFVEIKEESPKSNLRIINGIGKDTNINTTIKNSALVIDEKVVPKKLLFGENLEDSRPIKKFITFETKNPNDVKEDIIDNSKDINSEDEIDPLDSFMQEVNQEVIEINEKDKHRDIAELEKNYKNKIDKFEEEDPVVEKKANSQIAEQFLAMAKKMKKKEVPTVDHPNIQYIKIRKNFWVPPLEHQNLTPEEIADKRLMLDGIKINGKDCPIPIEKWSQCGMPSMILDILKSREFEKPTAIQAQTIPAILAGRDVIGIAKTGSGKTLAFLLPLFRHVKDQPPIDSQKINGHFVDGETGPIALIMSPTRELAQQTHAEIKIFSTALGLKSICAFGGTNIMNQISEVKKGVDVMVCTPGRLIDLMAANQGRLLNLNRVSYLVLDEADRMFDMGFEPQVMKIIESVRPDKQTLLFSATFPKLMDALVRKVLISPLEILAGSRAMVSDCVKQIIEVWDDKSRFYRLLKILGIFFNSDIDESNEKETELEVVDKYAHKVLKIKPLEEELFGRDTMLDVPTNNRSALIFVDRQDACDNLLKDLIKHKYSCLSLHGGKDQQDRADTIMDFKLGNVSILIATSIAARGLDVKNLGLVVNYAPPNHLEDYVHRVGRTGRAGKKGVAVTLVSPDEMKAVPDLVRALAMAKVPIPVRLRGLANEFGLRVKLGMDHYAGSGFGGKGLTQLDMNRDIVKQIQGHSFDPSNQAEEMASKKNDGEEALPAMLKHAKPKAIEAFKKAREAAKLMGTNNQASTSSVEDVYTLEIEINDYPQHNRWLVTSKEILEGLQIEFGAAVEMRGVLVKKGLLLPPGQRKKHLLLKAPDKKALENSSKKILEILERNEQELKE